MEQTTKKICPFCQTVIENKNNVIICEKCGIAHHSDCWAENNFKCTTYGCKYEKHLNIRVISSNEIQNPRIERLIIINGLRRKRNIYVIFFFFFVITSFLIFAILLSNVDYFGTLIILFIISSVCTNIFFRISNKYYLIVWVFEEQWRL